MLPSPIKRKNFHSKTTFEPFFAPKILKQEFSQMIFTHFFSLHAAVTSCKKLGKFHALIFL